MHSSISRILWQKFPLLSSVLSLFLSVPLCASTPDISSSFPSPLPPSQFPVDYAQVSFEKRLRMRPKGVVSKNACASVEREG